MPRPQKKRIVEKEPLCRRFIPQGGENDSDRVTTAEFFGRIQPVILSIDEFETVRLIDLLGMDQSQCAKKMQVARTTAQNIYNSARQKLAVALVYGRELRIEGGEYELYEEFSKCRGCDPSGGTVEHTGGIADICGINHKKEDETLRIAVTYDPDSGDIFQHFGKTSYFKLYETNGTEVKTEVLSTNGQGHGALAGVLTDLKADVLICGGIGAGAQNALSAMGIRLYGGCAGSADTAVKDFLNNSLRYQEDIKCDHHDGECQHDTKGCH